MKITRDIFPWNSTEDIKVPPTNINPLPHEQFEWIFYSLPLCKY